MRDTLSLKCDHNKANHCGEKSLWELHIVQSLSEQIRAFFSKCFKISCWWQILCSSSKREFWKLERLLSLVRVNSGFNKFSLRLSRFLLKANPYWQVKCNQGIAALLVTGCNKVLYDELNLYSAYSIWHIQMRFSHFLMMWVRWDRSSAYEGAPGSRYQSISYLTKFTQPIKVGDIYARRDHHTGNFVLLAKGESETHRRNHVNPSLTETCLNYSS